MDELFDAMQDPEFMFFIDDYSFSAHMVAEFQDMTFLEYLARTMEMNRD